MSSTWPISRRISWRRMFLTLCAAAVVGTTAMSAPASARGGRGGGRGYGRGIGRGWVGPAVGLGIGLGLAAGYPYYAGYPYGYYGYRGCWRRAVVETPWGPRVRRIWVCD
jgi:hypothetical protein